MSNVVSYKRSNPFDAILEKDNRKVSFLDSCIMELILADPSDPPPHMKKFRKIRKSDNIAIPTARAMTARRVDNIVTPLALEMLDLLRCTYYVITPNTFILASRSPINDLRTRKLQQKYTSFQAKLSTHAHQEKIECIKRVFAKAQMLFNSSETDIKAYNPLADELRKQIHLETKDVTEIGFFPGNPFLVRMTHEPAHPSPVYVSEAMLKKARRVYILFIKNVHILSSNKSFCEKVTTQMRTLIGLFASNVRVINSFHKMFLKGKFSLIIKEGPSFIHHKVTKTHATISLVDVDHITIPATNGRPDPTAVTDNLEFQTKESSIFWLYHELIHHVIYSRNITIPKNSELNKSLMTNDEETMVIGIGDHPEIDSVNDLRSMLAMPLRTRHRGTHPVLQTLTKRAQVLQLASDYLYLKKFTSLLDLEHRIDLEDRLKPRNIFSEIKKMQIVREAPTELREHFKSIGYKDRFTKAEVLGSYKKIFKRGLTNQADMKIMLSFYTVPQETFAEFFDSELRHHEGVHASIIKNHALYKETETATAFRAKFKGVLMCPKNLKKFNAQVAFQDLLVSME